MDRPGPLVENLGEVGVKRPSVDELARADAGELAKLAVKMSLASVTGFDEQLASILPAVS